MRWLPLILLLHGAAAENPVDRHLGVDFPPCGDATFLRRASLDLVGRLPAPDDVRAFLKDRAPDKREKKVDELLASPAFAEFWGRRLSAAWIGYPRGDFDFLVNADGFGGWVGRRLDAGASLADIVREILAASGSSQSKPETSFLNRFAMFDDQGRSSLRIAEATGRVGQAFLGWRIGCAQCHDHPYDRWTQEQFYGVAAFFRRTGISARTFGVANKKSPVKYAFEHYDGGLEPQWLDGAKPESEELREELGRLLTKDPQFARAMANRLWAYLTGRGVVDPFDDFAPKNKARHPELLESLAADLAKDFDLRRALRTIALSAHYQRRDAALRPLTPEQHWGAIASATLIEEAALDAKAVRRLAGPYTQGKALPLLRRWFIGMIARTSEAESASSFAAYTANVQQVLQTLNPASPIYAGTRAGNGGRLDRAKPESIVDELYLATLSRLPTAMEHERASRAKPERLFWALLNCDEFLFNH